MSNQVTSDSTQWNVRRKEEMETYQKAAATRAEYLLRRQKKEVLEKARRIAIVGAGTDPHCASHIRTEKLLGYGLEVLPVIPGCGQYLGLTCYANLREIPGEVDVVQIYPCEGISLPTAARESVAKRAKAFWVEEDEASPEVREILSEGKVRFRRTSTRVS